MTIDLLDFDSDTLYFDEPIDDEAAECLKDAANSYGEDGAENRLMRAYFLAPDHPMVLVALYRYYYYQHCLKDALLVAERVLVIFAKRLNLPDDWRQLNADWLGSGVLVSMTMVRFYMLALKGSGYLQLRLGNYQDAFERLRKVADLDENDRLGAQALLETVTQALHDNEETAVV